MYGKFNQKSTFKPQVIEKSPETEQQIWKLLEQSILFQNLTKEDMECVVKATEVNDVEQGQTVITEGEQGDSLYIVSSGEYDCHKMISQKNTYLKTYKTGEAFGELSLMYNAPRAATIACKTKGTLFKLDRQTFRNIVQEAAIKRRTYNSKILEKVDILAEMDAYEREQVCDALKEETYGANEYVMKQGETGDRFYIIAEGQCIAEKKEGSGPVQKVFEYKSGEYFGEIALMKNTVRQASIKTTTPCRLVWIDRNTFKRLLGPLETILSRNMEKYRKMMDHWGFSLILLTLFN